MFRNFTIQYLIQATFYEVCQLLLKHIEIEKEICRIKKRYSSDSWKWLKRITIKKEISLFMRKSFVSPLNIYLPLSRKFPESWQETGLIIMLLSKLKLYLSPPIWRFRKFVMNWTFPLHPHSPVSLNELPECHLESSEQ